jgi:hypothetical protein
MWGVGESVEDRVRLATHEVRVPGSNGLFVQTLDVGREIGFDAVEKGPSGFLTVISKADGTGGDRLSWPSHEVVLPLEIAIFDEKGRPTIRRVVGMNDHDGLMKFAERRSAKYLTRMNEYYGEVEIETEDLPGFRDELQSLLVDPELSSTLRDLVDALHSMVTRAISEGRKMGTIPD